MQELVKQLEALLVTVGDAMQKLGITADKEQASELAQETAAADFWSRGDAAEVSQQLAGLQKHVAEWEGLQTEIQDALDVARLTLEEGADDDDLLAQLAETYQSVAARYAEREFELKLSGPYD